MLWANLEVLPLQQFTTPLLQRTVVKAPLGLYQVLRAVFGPRKAEQAIVEFGHHAR